MTLGSRHVHKARTVINSKFTNKDWLSLSGWSRPKIEQRFESSIACMSHRDHRTYAEVPSNKGDMGYKGAFCNAGHMNTPVTDLAAPKQVVNNVSSTSMNNSIDSKYREVHAKGSLINSQNTGIFDANELNPIDSDLGVHNFQVSNLYNIPVTNRFQMLEINQETQVSADNGSYDTSKVTQDVWKAKRSDVKLSIKPNTQDIPFASHAIQTFSAEEPIHSLDPDFNQLDTVNHNPDLIPEYQKCKAQIGTKFGCIPLTQIYVYKGEPKTWDPVLDVLTAHRLIRDTGIPNFLGLRIPVQTNLNIASWSKHLVDYFDQQLLDFIEFGFPLDFDRARDLQSTLVNHASARMYPDHVDKYVQEEVDFQAVLGPLDHEPFDIHISPFMTREKLDSNSRRTIMDLSFSKGLSVNDGILNNIYLHPDFQMQYPSVDSIIQTLNEIGPSAHIFKVDISSAFRHIRIDPGDIDLLGLQDRGKLYLDLSLPFGFRLGAFFFSKRSDSVRFIMNKNNALLSYIDDLIYCDLPSTIYTSYQFLLDILQDLGLDISLKKLCPPSIKVVCLGILFDTIHRTISIPDTKLQEICRVCENWLDKRLLTKMSYSPC